MSMECCGKVIAFLEVQLPVISEIAVFGNRLAFSMYA